MGRWMNTDAWQRGMVIPKGKVVVQVQKAFSTELDEVMSSIFLIIEHTPMHY